MELRPKFIVKLTPADQVFEILGWIFISAIWIFTVINYASLPDTIPTHYNSEGQADGFGGKMTIWILPVLAIALFVALTQLNKFPHVFNYPTNITPDNAIVQYTHATRLIRYVKLIIVFIFGLITYRTIQTANGQAEGLGGWFLPLSMGLIFVPLVYFLIQSFGVKR
jgi:uncharacterized membrane protein